MSWNATKSLLQASVTDTGAGMAASEQANLFKQYYQGAKGAGGLGLTICQQMVSEVCC